VYVPKDRSRLPLHRIKEIPVASKIPAAVKVNPFCRSKMAPASERAPIVRPAKVAPGIGKFEPFRAWPLIPAGHAFVKSVLTEVGLTNPAKVILSNEALLLNATTPIVVTVLGIVTAISAVSDANAAVPIFTNPSDKIKTVRPGLSLMELVPIVASVAGIPNILVSLCPSVSFRAESAMAVKGVEPSNLVGMVTSVPPPAWTILVSVAGVAVS